MKEKPKKSVRMWVARDNDENIAYKESYLASRDIILLDPALFPSVKRVTVRLA